MYKRFATVLMCAAVFAPVLAEANPANPAMSVRVQQELSAEPPRLRALMEHALFLGQGTEGQRDDFHAYRLLCEAASHGSALAHQLAASLALRHGDAARPYALFHLRAASDLGDSEAGARLMEYALMPQPDRGLPSRAVNALAPECLSGGVDAFILPAQRSGLKDAVTGQGQPQGFAAHDAQARTFDLGRYLEKAPRSKQSVAQMVQRVAREMGLDPRLALAIAAAESNFEPAARSPKNAQGVMQLIPATASRFGVTDAFDAEQNIRGGVSYLKWLLRHFDGRIEHVVAAYNAGEGAVKKHGGVPPYAETRHYVGRVLEMIR